MALRLINIGIVCYPTYGGSGVVATELGMALASKGHNVHFISYKRPARLGIYQTNVYYHEVSTSEYPLFDFKPYDTALASKIVDVALHNNLDVLHVHYAIPHAIIGFLAREILFTKGKRIPLITTLHGTDITLVGVDPSFYPVVEFSINQSNTVTAVSNSLKSDTLKAFNIQKDIHVIPNFIDLERFKPQDPRSLRCKFATSDQKIISHISNFRKVKRIDDIIRMFEIIQKTVPSKLLLIGDGPEFGSLVNLVDQLKLTESVIFLGKQDSVEELLAISDLFMLTSDKESFGLSALEAMACGVPVISSDAGGLKEVNIHGITGFSCPVGDFEMMSDYAIQLLTDDKLHQLFKQNALTQARVIELSNILPMYEQIYESSLNARDDSPII